MQIWSKYFGNVNTRKNPNNFEWKHDEVIKKLHLENRALRTVLLRGTLWVIQKKKVLATFQMLGNTALRLTLLHLPWVELK